MNNDAPGTHSGKTTLRDVAQATGFSINTVSHALKDKPDISAATKERIRLAARDLGYIADSVAGSLRSGVSRTIAVILGDMSNPHFGLWVREIETSAFRQGYSTLIINTDEDEQVEREAIKAAVGKRVDGIILCPTQKSDCNLILLKSISIPFVLIGRRYQDADLNYVVPDDVEGGCLAAGHLLDRGCRHILMLNGPAHISSARERYEGYCKAHAERGLAVDPRYLLSVGVQSGQCRRTVERVLAEGLDFDAVVAFSDLLALETLATLRSRPVPVVGFDDILGGMLLPVSLTSVAPDLNAVASCAVSRLMEMMAARQQKTSAGQPVQTVLPVRLYSR
ncbi:MAG: LacI family DNA-binding transcriptional regulator [Clostridiaceae bacterium]|nr:LacI family DNA-binding transcriptional regulator [Clostridiaceae bacterium]